MWQTIVESYKGYAGYLWYEISHPGWHNYFYWLLGLSAFFFGLEIIRPWREKQARFRKDFWLDFFYMFFNYFLFALLIFHALSQLVSGWVEPVFARIPWLDSTQQFFAALPVGLHLLIGFVIMDFFQWNTHRLLHSVPWLWEFHKVHHSVKQMGFAAHLRYHWMENVVYKTILFTPLLFIGYSLRDFFVIHILATAIGHYNHSNFILDKKAKGFWGGTLIFGIIALGFGAQTALAASVDWLNPFSAGLLIMLLIAGLSFVFRAPLGRLLSYLFNSPEMHIWHHAKHLPKDRPMGVNFGLTLAIWDYLFGTHYIPYEGRDEELGFEGDEKFPEGFAGQQLHGLVPKATAPKP